MGVHYYIYYRIDPASATQLSQALNAMQTDLAHATGIAGRFLRRADDASTWMEIYENVEILEPFEATLAQLLQQHGIARFLLNGTTRHVERFMPCA